MPRPPLQPQSTRKPPLTGPQKADQRARNKAAGSVTRSGSSGVGLRTKKWPHLDWKEVQDDVEWVTDIAGVISHTQVGAAGQVTMLVSVPLAYAHAVIEAHAAGQGGSLFIRVYNVPVEKFMEAMEHEELRELDKGMFNVSHDA